VLAIGSGGSHSAEAHPEQGTLVLVGNVLRYDHPTLWGHILDLASRNLVDLNIIGAANARAKLYGGYAKRALERYGATAALLPVASDPEAFGIPYREAVDDPALAATVREGRGIFFVGGAPQRLSRVLLHADGSPTALARAIADAYAEGGIVVGGIPGPAGVRTGFDAMSALERGRLQERDLYRGLGLIADGWYVDQHFFSPGRLAETLVAMSQLGLSYGLGVGADTAAVVEAGSADVVGNEGVMLIDLSDVATNEAVRDGFNVKGARLSYLDAGDRFDMNAKKATPHPAKRDGFEMRPSAGDTPRDAVDPPALADALGRGRLVQLMREALDGGANEAIGFAFRDGAGPRDRGFRFRLYTGPDSVGWIAVDEEDTRFTILNIYLDITSVIKAEAKSLM
jgi:cyanophycinase